MNVYQIRTEHYRELLRDCRRELILLGYTAATARLAGAAEFLQRMEAAGKTELDRIGKADIEAHVAYLYERPGRNRDGGGLSGYTVLGLHLLPATALRLRRTPRTDPGRLSAGWPALQPSPAYAALLRQPPGDHPLVRRL